MSLKLADGKLEAEENGDSSYKASLDFPAASDGQWHYISVSKTSTSLSIHVDDLFSKVEQREQEASSKCHPYRRFRNPLRKS